MTLLPTVARGVALGLFAGVVQLPVAQAAGLAVGRRERADVALRLVQCAGDQIGWSPSKGQRWLLATLFHFGYAASWGTLYTIVREAGGGWRLPWLLTGGFFGGAIYCAAFSRFGGGVLLGSESPPDRRAEHEWVVQWASALSFALTAAYVEDRTAPTARYTEDGGVDAEARV